MNNSLVDLYDSKQPFNLEEFLPSLGFTKKGLYKCRVIYDDGSKHVEFVLYAPQSIDTLKIVEDNSIVYPHKFKERGKIDRAFGKREGCDDILIIKNNLVTDSSYSNVVFKKSGSWFTPESPLLPGTMRQRLLDKGLIKTEVIRKEDIETFECFKLINAMLGFEGPEVSIKKIIF
jgi:4-amino-4-deoxychorismate lyase